MRMQQRRTWLLLALVVGMLVVGFLGLNGIASMTEIAQSGSLEATDAPSQAPLPAPTDNQQKVVLEELGMACMFCRAAVSAKLDQIPGVLAYEVTLETDSATVLYEPSRVTIADLKQAIAEAGYQVRGVRVLEE